MNTTNIQPADIIAIAAIFIAIMTTLIQALYERSREWHTACELLFQSIDSLFTEIKELAIMPDETNHISYQHCLNHRINLLKHYSERFILQRKRIKNACNVVIFDFMELPLKIEYEELINKGFKNKKKQKENYFNFISEIRTYTEKASKALIN